jgi:cytochrome c oxidase subunit 3
MSHAASDHAVDSAHAHSPHLAHHFNSPAQQYASAKLGMWVFLGTELLMFGGLFCAYGVYRYSHPEVFSFAHQALDPFWGGVNTMVLITSSLTMAMAVRYAQLGQRTPLLVCLALSILGGAGFMSIKYVEYKAKWEHHLFPGRFNVYNTEFAHKDDVEKPQDLSSLTHHGEHQGESAPIPKARQPASAPTTKSRGWSYVDPLAGTNDEPKIKPNFADPVGLTAAQSAAPIQRHPTLNQLGALDQQRVNTFFSIYFCMTGLHGLHVLIGMALITWVLIRAWPGTFGPTYFTPVDLVGLYWHLVDLIWIFLFPLLYLIH